MRKDAVRSLSVVAIATSYLISSEFVLAISGVAAKRTIFLRKGRYIKSFRDAAGNRKTGPGCCTGERAKAEVSEPDPAAPFGDPCGSVEHTSELSRKNIELRSTLRQQ